MNALPKPQTRMNVTTTFMAKDHVPNSLLETYEKQQAALNETLVAISDLIAESDRFKALTSPERPIRNVSLNPLGYSVRHVNMVDGVFREVGTTQSPVAGKGFIEASTLNLLLSSKILTDDEKRAVLKARDLLPEVDEAEAEE